MGLAAIVWDVNPTFIDFGFIKIGYYGILWALAFVVGSYLFQKIVKKEGLDPEMVNSAFMIMLISTIIGARLGHCYFYEAKYFLENPLAVITEIRKGGLASHGAAIGLLIGIWVWSRKWKMPYVWMLDRIGIVVAIGGVFIRFGNLINSEIVGVPTDLPWGFIFVRSIYKDIAVHPTQIYEMIAYTITFLVLAHLYWRTKLSDRRGLLFGIFLIMLFGSRFLIEFIKEPQVGFEADMSLVMGQILSIPFILAGIGFVVYALKNGPKPYEYHVAALPKKPVKPKK